MDGLIFFQEQKAAAELEPDPTALKLRDRLLSPTYSDSVDTRITLLAELVFRTYIHHLHLLRGNRQ